MMFKLITFAIGCAAFATAGPSSLTFSFDACDSTVETVALLANVPGVGNWWERAALDAAKDGKGVWSIKVNADFVADGATEATPFEASLHYKWIVNGNVSPVYEHAHSETCHSQYSERIVSADFTDPVDIMGCVATNECPVLTTFTFDSCDDSVANVKLLYVRVLTYTHPHPHYTDSLSCSL
jgi:hypothetical protein